MRSVDGWRSRSTRSMGPSPRRGLIRRSIGSTSTSFEPPTAGGSRTPCGRGPIRPTRERDAVRHAVADPRAGYHPSAMTESMTAAAVPEASAPPEIQAESPVYNASLVRREDLTESLAYFWVRFDADPTPFTAGQYMTIGVMGPEWIVQRPYSVASPPAVAGSEGYEFYVRRVQGGTFTPLLFELPVGHRMRMIGPKGKFMLLPDDDRTHHLISSGTGNAPFVAMMRQLLIDGQPRPVVFLNGVSYADELGYRERVEGWEQTGEYPVRFIATVSRPNDPSNAGWTG